MFMVVVWMRWGSGTVCGGFTGELNVYVSEK